ncbi:ABC transporter substrate-binding protein [Pseudomonas sp. HR96]|uniref:ABC transporter substrate-binding protein n=1 Tax=Pseudomonas sp. HR96 TaxID=1027966 RepID=UPI002A75BEC7|nr:ABC transporter substrate-binding protein [Pseudomonas sp. HR96]WPP00095.1 ABC transporter substrate-binding protein [Pseudomonas sp. HR96]
MADSRNFSRRSVIKGAGITAAAIAAPTVWTGNRAFGADTITVADVGGAVAPAIKSAFYDPFEKETGIKVIGVAHDSDPVTQFKLLVDANTYIWDVSMVTQDHVARLTQPKNYLAELNLPAAQVPDILPGMATNNWLGFSVFGIVMAYNREKFSGNAPASWADYWNPQKFPGRRGLYKSPWGVLEMALLADGVAAADLYPLDVDRAFKKLDAIRNDVAVWWTAGAQNTQTLQNGEVDISDTWSARGYAAIAAGAPLEILWQGLYSVDGWSIPLGTPRLDLARKFVEFCMRPEHQAAYSSLVANGPSNRKAFDIITPERAKVLPSSPENIKGLSEMDAVWWGKNYDAVTERFQEWMLG